MILECSGIILVSYDASQQKPTLHLTLLETPGMLNHRDTGKKERKTWKIIPLCKGSLFKASNHFHLVPISLNKFKVNKQHHVVVGYLILTPARTTSSCITFSESKNIEQFKFIT